MIRFVIKNKEVGMEEWLVKQSESKPQTEEYRGANLFFHKNKFLGMKI